MSDDGFRQRDDVRLGSGGWVTVRENSDHIIIGVSIGVRRGDTMVEHEVTPAMARYLAKRILELVDRVEDRSILDKKSPEKEITL